MSLSRAGPTEGLSRIPRMSGSAGGRGPSSSSTTSRGRGAAAGFASTSLQGSSRGRARGGISSSRPRRWQRHRLPLGRAVAAVTLAGQQCITAAAPVAAATSEMTAVAAAEATAAAGAASCSMDAELAERRASGFAACARPAVAGRIRESYRDLGAWPSQDQLPVVYHPIYNIGFFGLENLHPFDSKKYRHVVGLLERDGVLHARQLVRPAEASREALLSVHSEAYLRQLESSPLKVAQVTELAPLALLPSALLRWKVLRPMRYMAGGTMLAAALALECGWAVNLGGGMHHASWSDGGGWCVYDDITLAVRRLRTASGGAVQRVMVVDLDVHMGNGHERSKLHFKDTDMYTVDVYNRDIYPMDNQAKAGIDAAAALPSGTRDQEYLGAVQGVLQKAFSEFPRPHLVVYNAGTDVLDGDPLGRWRVTPEAVTQRDELVFKAAQQHGAPIVMLLSGGYTPASTLCIAASLRNLLQRVVQAAGGGA